MPKNVKKQLKTNKHMVKTSEILYADKSNKQDYYKITKELGCMKFKAINPAGKEIICGLPKGVARKSRLLGINKLKRDMWILAHPLGDNLDGVYEIVTVYTKKHTDILDKEGCFKCIEENKNEENNDDFLFEGEEEKVEESDDDIDIDNL